MIFKARFFILFFYFFLLLKENFISCDQNIFSRDVYRKRMFPSSFLKKHNLADISNQVKLEIELLDKEIFHIRITDPLIQKFEVPRHIFNWAAFNSSMKQVNILQNGLEILNERVPLDFNIKNRKNNSVFQFMSEPFFFSKYYNSFSYKLTTDMIFGYGERAHKFKLDEGIYTIWLNDTSIGTVVDDNLGGRNLYGHQPFILNRDKDGNFLGILFINTNAQDLIISKPDIKGNVKLEQRTIGGIIELVIFLGETPNDVIIKFQSFIGFPVLPPLWAHGWHQSRYGYPNDTFVDQIVEKYISLNLPLDSIWTDINYMNSYQDFTIDPINFGNLPNLVDKWNSQGINFIPILDIGIFHDKLNPYFLLGLKYNCFIMSNYTNKPLLSKIWPGMVSFPDFTHPNTSFLWEQGLTDFFTLVKFDGLWLDVNEPQSLVNDPYGEVADNYDPNKNKYYNIPYKPGNGRIKLEQKGISINALMYGKGNQYIEDNTVYNYKPLNPYYQIRMTNRYIKKNFMRRPFILSRANFIGMGKYANHWLGDNLSTYEQMRLSIPGVFNYQMFGFNLVGADVCGFLGNVTDELCARWHILGAFYPFARNHNNMNQTDQEPWRLGDKTLYSTMLALRLKYSLLRYSYTYSFLMSLRGGMYFQPLFFEFPYDEETYNHIDEQIMLGKSILFSPALHEGENDYDAYFPNSHWNEIPSGASFIDYDKNNTKGKIVKLSGAYVKLHLHLRGGSIIPFQDVTAYNITRSHHLLNETTELIINPDHQNMASGIIIYDDGISLEAEQNKKYIHIEIYLNNNVIGFVTKNSFDDYYNNDVKLNCIIIYRGNKWSNYTKIEAKNVKGENIKVNTKYYENTNIFKVIFEDKIKMNNIQSVTFLN